jgi:hypothetical protein
VLQVSILRPGKRPNHEQEKTRPGWLRLIASHISIEMWGTQSYWVKIDHPPVRRYRQVQEMDRAMQGRRFGTGRGSRFLPNVRKHWRLTAGSVFLLAAAALGAALLTGSHAARLAAVVAPYPHELAQVSFAVAGDVIPHEPVRAAAAAAVAAGDPTNSQGWGALFSDVADVFQKADFGFVNLETPVAPAHSHARTGPSHSCSTRPLPCSKA